MKITIEKELEDWWASSTELSFMSDQEIIDLIKEDITSLLENANFIVTRTVLEEKK